MSNTPKMSVSFVCAMEDAAPDALLLLASKPGVQEIRPIANPFHENAVCSPANSIPRPPRKRVWKGRDTIVIDDRNGIFKGLSVDEKEQLLLDTMRELESVKRELDIAIAAASANKREFRNANACSYHKSKHQKCAPNCPKRKRSNHAKSEDYDSCSESELDTRRKRKMSWTRAT
jgi:hypothetical protein